MITGASHLRMCTIIIGKVQGVVGKTAFQEAGSAGFSCFCDPAECLGVFGSQRLELVETFPQGQSPFVQ